VLTRRLCPPGPLDLALTLGPLQRGRHDPTCRIGRGAALRATRTPDGPATLELRRVGGGIEARAWGPGAGWALDGVPALLGFDDEPESFAPAHPLVRDLQRRSRGLRLGRSGSVAEVLVPTILEQKVTGIEARRSYGRLVRRFGEPAPGPLGLTLPPDPARLAALPYHAFHPCGVERRRADTIRRTCARAARLDRLAHAAPADATRVLTAFPGVGPWTAAEVCAIALGDPDAVSVGDYHLPHVVAWALAGEPRADDARMLELLEPFRPQRARVIRLLVGAGAGPPRRAPPAPLRDLASI
jgi:3-methyladenine DNA glycosylase/8-oxoguanine DNA glycosylase